ncbi:MAG: hypothetical protein ACXAD7_15715 [Candidatus Kariarchaeaceae archaeon]|jgi:hypothetical protein
MKQEHRSLLILLFFLLISVSFVDACTYPNYPGPRISEISLTDEPNTYQVVFRSATTPNEEPEVIDTLVDTKTNQIKAKTDSTENKTIETNYQPLYQLTITTDMEKNTTLLWEIKNSQNELVFEYQVTVPGELARYFSFYSNALKHAFFVYGIQWSEYQGISVSMDTLEVKTLSLSLDSSWYGFGVLDSSKIYDDMQKIQVDALCCVCISWNLLTFTETEILQVDAFNSWEHHFVDTEGQLLLEIENVDEEGDYAVKEIDLQTLEEDLWSFSIADLEKIADVKVTTNILSFTGFLSGSLSGILIIYMKRRVK